MKILITGSSGMLGTDLCKALAKDHDIAGVDINVPPVKVHAFHSASVIDADEIGRIMEGEKPDLVIHAAAWTDVDGCERDPEKAEAVNVKGTRNIVNAAAGRNIPVMFISTDFVFDGNKREPYMEDDDPCPVSVYGRTKYEAEEVVKSGSSAYAIVRTSWLFGRNGRNFVDTILSKAASGERLRVVNDQTGSPTYTKDLSAALAGFLCSGRVPGRDIFHVSNSGRCSWYEFAEYITGYKGFKEAVIEKVASDELARPAKRPCFSVLDNGKFSRATGYIMRPWKEALEEYLGGVGSWESRVDRGG
ncbi:MAG: dTDP-4-dehydrorhamnose reductase [Candidatus Omnitrophica bacterium]|nr:dTDP-4-dehydrorhamnose reductase [Candidatus Omnitrophota bacterium]